MISHLPYYYSGKTKENNKHGTGEKLLIILVGKREKPMIVKEQNNEV
jgi:hypothetical protein